MSGFFDRLIERASAPPTALRPATRSRFNAPPNAAASRPGPAEASTLREPVGEIGTFAVGEPASSRPAPAPAAAPLHTEAQSPHMEKRKDAEPQRPTASAAREKHADRPAITERQARDEGDDALELPEILTADVAPLPIVRPLVIVSDPPGIASAPNAAVQPAVGPASAPQRTTAPPPQLSRVPAQRPRVSVSARAIIPAPRPVARPPRLRDTDAEPSVVRVRIGRIDVRAVMTEPAKTQPRERHTPQSLGLDEYLRQRMRGER